MELLAVILVGLVAALHAYFLVLEMFLWTTAGRRAFGLTKEFAEQTTALAANQGLYNGFLVAGLVWGLVDDDLGFTVFFLGCVIVAGLYGGMLADAFDRLKSNPRDAKILLDPTLSPGG